MLHRFCCLMGCVFLLVACGEEAGRPSSPTPPALLEPATVEILIASRDRFYAAVDKRDHDQIKAKLDDGTPDFFRWLARHYDPNIALNEEPLPVLTYRLLAGRLNDQARPTEADVIDLFLDMGWFDLIFPRDEVIEEIRPTEIFGKTKSSRVEAVVDGPIDIEVLAFKWDNGVWRLALNDVANGRRQLLNIESMMLVFDSGVNDEGELDSRLIQPKSTVLIRALYDEAERPIPEELSMVLKAMDKQWSERP